MWMLLFILWNKKNIRVYQTLTHTITKRIRDKTIQSEKTDGMTQSKRGDQNNTSYLPSHGTAD